MRWLEMIYQELLDNFRDYLIVKDCSEGTIENYLISVKQLIKYVGKPPRNITQKELDNYKIYLKNKYAQNTLIPKIHGINHFLKLIGKEYEIKAPGYLMKNRDCLTIEEVKLLFEKTENNPRDNAILKTLYFTGIRRNELVNLNIEDIDFKKQKLSINNGKGNSYDKINIHPVALQSINEYLKSRRTPKPGHETALFLNNKGERLGHMSITHIVKNSGAKAGITKRIYPHLFRASLITHMDENGASMMEIKAQSRHKDVKTLEIYIRHSEEHLKNVYLKTVPVLDESQTQEQPQPVTQKIELTQQPQITQQKQQSREDKYIELLREKLIDNEEFMKLMEKSHQHLIGYE
jgi:integrase/recombinase XerD